MAERLYALFPDHEHVLALEPEELAGVLLEILNTYSETERNLLHRGNFLQQGYVREYPAPYQPQLLQALSEAWSYLERAGFLVPKVGESFGWFVLSRRALRLSKRSDLAAYQSAALLPTRLLHPILATKVVSPFIRGEYDTAVFQAFKEVEVAVRAAARASASEVGVPLMRKAFGKEGSLADPSAIEAEREAMSNLFAGAIGSYKNPHSHRNISLDDPAEAVELILLASHLLRIVDSRTQELPEDA